MKLTIEVDVSAVQYEHELRYVLERAVEKAKEEWSFLVYFGHTPLGREKAKLHDSFGKHVGTIKAQAHKGPRGAEAPPRFARDK